MLKKRFIAFISLLAFFCAALPAPPALANGDIKVLVNDSLISFDQPPAIENERVLVPLRAIFESLGAGVSYDEKSRTVFAEKGDIEISLAVGESRASVNGAAVELDAPARIVNGRTLVPVRFIAEGLNCFVGWQEKTRTVFVADGGKRPQRNLSVHFLDVGQGDCILIMLPGGENMLIDAGNSPDGPAIVNYIKALGIETLDFIVATHPHADHIGGMEKVINSFKIGAVYMPGISHNTKTFEGLLAAIQSKGLKIQRARAGVNILSSNGLCADMVSPAADFYDNLNNYSAAVRLAYLNNTFLFTGDMEAEAEKEINADIGANVLKVAHHGSDTSTSAAFLSRVSPEYAIISVGAGNSYNHPSALVLSRLRDFGAQIYRTDEAGTIIAESDGYSITVNKNLSTAQGENPPAQGENPPPQGVNPPAQGENPPTGGSAVSQPEADGAMTVYITKTGSKYHRAGCSYLKKSATPIPLSQARLKYEPCSVCNPPR